MRFEATATDLEDGDLGASLQWSSDVDGALGVGISFSLPLTIGPHQITASVTDSANGTTVGAVSVTVNAIRGDINGDAAVNITDMLLLQKHVLGIEIIIDAGMLFRADVYPATAGDSELGVSDLLLMQELAIN